MLQLKTDSLKEFQKKAQQIQANTLLPILSNLKLVMTEDGICTIIKNSINSICIGVVEGVGAAGSYLINERIFFSIVGTSKKEVIEVGIHEGQILIQDDDKTFLPIENPDDYPNPPEYNSNIDCFKFSNEHIRAIGIASNYINESETSGPFQFVHMKEENIFAFHINYFYINGGFKSLPSASFRNEETAIITQLIDVEFMDLPNHHIFFSPGYTYIFTKAETNIMDISSVIGRLNLAGKNFTCNTEEFNNFVQRANSISESPVATCSLNPAGLFVKLQLNDANFSRSNERMIACTGEPDEFTFNSRLIAGAMKAIPFQTLNAKTNQNCLIINNDKEWFCFVGMSKN